MHPLANANSEYTHQRENQNAPISMSESECTDEY